MQIISLITGFVTRLTRRVPLVEQKLPTLPEHSSSPLVFSGVRVTRFLVLCVCFVDCCVLLYFFFWPLCCLFFFDIQILITPLVSSNSSYNIVVYCIKINHWFISFDVIEFAVNRKLIHKLKKFAWTLITENLFSPIAIFYHVFSHINRSIHPTLVQCTSVELGSFYQKIQRLMLLQLSKQMLPQM